LEIKNNPYFIYMMKGKMIALKAAIEGLEVTPGRTFFVMKSANDRYQEFLGNHETYLDGTPKVYTSVKSAVSNAQDYDKVIVFPGVYDEGAVIDITQAGLKLRGSNTSNLMYGTTSLKASTADHIIITVSANEVEIDHLSFIQNNANVVISINSGTTGSAAVYKTHIHDCHFGSATATYGIDAGGTYDAVDTIIEDCSFVCGANVGVRLNGTRCAVARCVFQIGTAGEGIVHTPGTGDRPYTRYLDNKFFTEDSTNSVGITVTNTPTVGMLLIDGNTFANFADADHCVTKRTGYVGLNWFGITGLEITT
jgi:hypothetical protein